MRNFAKIIHKLKLKLKLPSLAESPSSVLCCWCEGLREASQDERAGGKEKKIWRMIQGFLFFHFCEIGGVAIIIHKNNDSKFD
jgi:hypothetical protein